MLHLSGLLKNVNNIYTDVCWAGWARSPSCKIMRQMCWRNQYGVLRLFDKEICTLETGISSISLLKLWWIKFLKSILNKSLFRALWILMWVCNVGSPKYWFYVVSIYKHFNYNSILPFDL